MKLKIAAIIIDAQNGFTPLCPDELPIAEALTMLSNFFRVEGSSGAFSATFRQVKDVLDYFGEGSTLLTTDHCKKWLTSRGYLAVPTGEFVKTRGRAAEVFNVGRR